MMKQIKLTIISVMIFMFCLNAGINGVLLAAPLTDAELTKAIDGYLSQKFPANAPGIAVLVMKNDRIVLRKGYGMANLELGVPIQPEMVFRLGSITKQFTAAAIMMLIEEGRVALEDEITKYIPDYPTQGTKITVHQLLNHTSGIKSYTGLAEWLPLMRKDLTVNELIAMFKDKPMDFKPGERFLYNNSGYVLLGAIIEKASGKTYEDFINERIFKKLGMKHSFYGHVSPIIPNRVAGYDLSGDGYKNADYLSMTQPYAAGSLISSVDDLYIWNEALFAGKVVSSKSFEKMITPTQLPDGKTEMYGYGLAMGELLGEKFVNHGGGIHGFSTQATRIPDKDVFVAVFSNCPGQKPDPDFVTQWIAALVCGKDVQQPKAVTLDAKTLEQVVGVYQIAEGQFRTITLEDNQLYSQRSGSTKMKIFPASKTEFYYDESFSHFTLVWDGQGKVTKMIMKGLGPDSEAIKTDKKPEVKAEVKLSNPEIFDAYVGVYENPMGLRFTLRRLEDKYFVRVDGQGEFEIFPLNDTRFFLKVVEADFEVMKDSNGVVTSLMLHQNGLNIELKKK